MTAPRRRPDLTPILVGNIDNALEWYDFVVFAFLAPVIGARFFPSADPLSGLLQAFGVFAVGHLMRPVEGMRFGHLGDRLGRKSTGNLAAPAWYIAAAALATTAVTFVATRPAPTLSPVR